MALTYTSVGTGPGANLPFVTDGTQKRVVVDVTLDNSYVGSGGYTLSAASLGLNQIQSAQAQIKTQGTTAAVEPFVDTTNSKLKLFGTTGAELSNAADLTSGVVRVLAWGY